MNEAKYIHLHLQSSSRHNHPNDVGYTCEDTGTFKTPHLNSPNSGNSSYLDILKQTNKTSTWRGQVMSEDVQESRVKTIGIEAGKRRQVRTWPFLIHGFPLLGYSIT